MVKGKAKLRTPLAKAQAILDEFLARAHALNSDENAVCYVEEVWLFGSMLRGAETVGDIDLALVTDRRPQYRIKGGYEQMKAHLEKVMANRDDVPKRKASFGQQSAGSPNERCSAPNAIRFWPVSIRTPTLVSLC